MQPPVKAQFNHRTLIRALRQEIHPSRLISTLTAALITGTIEVIYAVSFVAFIFSGDLAPYLSTGIGLLLFTSMTVNLIIALGSSSPGMVSGAQDAPAVILGVMAATMAARFSNSTATGEVLPTMVVAFAVTSILTGLCCFLLGQFKLGDLIRFIPYPVVGGFLAGTGWLLALGALSFMTNLSLPGELFQLLQPQLLLQWLPGCGFGMLLLVLLRRYHHFLLMPGLVVGAIILFYSALLATRTSTTEAQALGLLLPAFPSGSLWHPLSLSDLAQADWGLIRSQIGQIVAVMLITIISIVLNVTGIELAIEGDLDLNRELKASGIANLASGLGGGVIGFHFLGSSILSCDKLGAKSRMVGVLIAAGLAVVLFAGASLVTLFPKPVLGGVTLLLGLDLLVEWVYDAWFKLPKADYAIVILILLIIASVGFLQGVGFGLLVSIILFVVNYSRVNVVKYTLSGATYQSNTVRSLPQSRLLQEEGEQIHILDLQGFLFFGTANALLHRIQTRLQDVTLRPLQFVVLNFKSVHGVDSSAVLSFVKLKQLFQSHAIKLVFTHLSPTINAQLKREGFFGADDPTCLVFPDLDRGLEWCENRILAEVPLRRSRSLPLVLQLNQLLPNHNHASELMSYLEEWDANQGDVVFQQNQPADAIYFIEVGQITLYFERQGQTIRVQTLGAGHLVGELDFFRHRPHQTTATVDAPSTLYRLSTESFHQMQQNQSEVAVAFQSAVLQILGDRLTSAYQEIADLLR